MSGIDLYLDFNGDRIRISGAKLRTQADADELIEAITIVRRLLPGASEKAVAVPPAGEVTPPTSPAPITEAPKPLPDSHETLRRPAEAKTSDQEPSVSDGSGGMQDGLPVHPATHSPAGKTAGSKGSAAPTLTARVAALNAEHPDWSGNQIHRALPGTKLDSVKGVLSALRKKLRGSPTSARPPAGAPEPGPTEERPPAPIRQPVAASPSSSAVVTKPMVKPKGTRFHLRDDQGLYLHYSCTQMTSDKAYAWSGTHDQLLACRQKFELAKDLAEHVIEKEQARAA